MNTTNPEQKQTRILKTLAIVGFIGLIILIAWFSIRLVGAMPSALTSFASLAESVYSYRTPELLLTSSKSSVAVKDTVDLAWNVPKLAGTFGLSYECIEGVSLEARVRNSLTVVPCGEILNIGAVSGIAVSLSSEKERYVDVPLSIHFFRTNNVETPLVTNTRSVLVTNIAIDPDNVVTTPVAPTPVEPEVEEEVKPAPVKPTTPTPTPKPTTTVIKKYTYGFPVSDPNGYTDLTASYLTVGTVEGKTFTPVGGLRKNSEFSAVQFEVKNTGTKTSGNWSYIAKLPDGTTFTSTSQNPLKPNERAVITVGFVTPTTGNYSIVVAIPTADKNSTNNSFSAPVAVR